MQPSASLRVGLRHVDLADAVLQAGEHAFETVHRHPRAVRAALAGGTVAGGRRLDQRLSRRQLLHAVEHSLVGGDDVFACLAVDHRLQQLRRRAHHIGLTHHRLGRLGVHQNHRVGVVLAQQLQLESLELVVHDAGGIPQQHVGAGGLLDVAAQMLVRCPQDLLALGVQVRDDGRRTRAGDHPIGARLHRRAGVGIHHNLAIRVRVAELGKVLGRAAEVERAGGVEVWHQHTLAWRKDLGGLAHEAHAGHDQCVRPMVATEARHLQRVGHAAAGLLREVLQVAVDVVVGHHHGVARLQLARDGVFQFIAARLRQGHRDLGPGMGDTTRTAGVGARVVVENLGHARRPPVDGGSVVPGLAS